MQYIHMSVRSIVREVLPIGKALTRKVVTGRSKGDETYSNEKPKKETKDNGSKRKIPNAAKVEALTLSGGWAHGVCLQASAIFIINTVHPEHATQFIDPEGSNASEVNPR
ncbi:hypothetical protein J1N35_013596 [Gossypium stocksii]|uniref:Uncharacterized protein n=1 Tax=Gossypium stocksii TaxID=47602 RepID=A0A9D3VT87_9ROSI|nr:hypothetical protein J1N35_013596 [Gossypium stocksii]